jgi:hypothetical protein
MTELAGWQNFYVIVGSSAGALVGLQFVVMALIVQIPNVRVDPQAGATFATPSVVHFGAVLLLSAIACVPWKGTFGIALLWGLLGFAGVLYVLVVARRLRAQNAYTPVLEDWFFHALLPLAAYGLLIASAAEARWSPRRALFCAGAAALVLLIVGIHNAWDAITYHVFVGRRKLQEDAKRPR